MQKNKMGPRRRANPSDNPVIRRLANAKNAFESLIQIKFLAEFLNSAACIDKLLLTCEHRMAGGANFNGDILLRRACFYNIAASAFNRSLLVIGMNSFFHLYHLFHVY